MSSSFLLSNNDNSNKGEKIKGKYQTLNINNLYKGKGLDAQRPGKSYGFQSLGKVTSSKKMPPPAILPSLRAENQGNDPNINLVSSGTSWASKEKSENSENIATNENQPKSVESSAPLTISNKTWNTVNSNLLELHIKPVSFNTMPYGPTKFATNFQKEFPSLNSESKSSGSPALNLSGPFTLANDLSVTTFSVASSNELKETQSGEANASPSLNETSNATMNYLRPQTTWHISMKKNGADDQTKKNGFMVLDDLNPSLESSKLGMDNMSDVKVSNNQPSKVYGLIDGDGAYKLNYPRNEAPPYYNYGYYYPPHQSYPYHHPHQYPRYPLPSNGHHPYAPLEPVSKKELYEVGYPKYLLYGREKVEYPPSDYPKSSYPISQSYRPLSYGHETPYLVRNDVRQDNAKYKKGYSYEDDFYHSAYYKNSRAPIMPIRQEVEGKMPYNHHKYAEDDSFVNYESFSNKERWNGHPSPLEYGAQDRLPYNKYANQKSPRPYFSPPVPLLSLSLDPGAICDKMGLDKRSPLGAVSENEKYRTKWEEFNGASDVECAYNYPKSHMRPASHDHVGNSKYDPHFYSKESPESFRPGSCNKFDEPFAPPYITAGLPVDCEVQDEDMWNNLRAKQNHEISQALERARLKKGDQIDCITSFPQENEHQGHRQNERRENVDYQRSPTKNNITKHGEVPTSPSYKAANPQHRASSTVNRHSNDTRSHRPNAPSQDLDSKTAHTNGPPPSSTAAVLRIRQRNSTGDTWDQKSTSSSVLATTKPGHHYQQREQQESFKERVEDKATSYRRNVCDSNRDAPRSTHGKTFGSKQEESVEKQHLPRNKGYNEPETRNRFNARDDIKTDLPNKKLPEDSKKRDYEKAYTGQSHISESRPDDRKIKREYKDLNEQSFTKNIKETVVPDKSPPESTAAPPKFKWVFEGGKIIKLPLDAKKKNVGPQARQESRDNNSKSTDDYRSKNKQPPPNSNNASDAPDNYGNNKYAASRQQPSGPGGDKFSQHTRVNDFAKSYNPRYGYNQAEYRKPGHYTRPQHTFDPYPPAGECGKNQKDVPDQKGTSDSNDRGRFAPTSSANYNKSNCDRSSQPVSKQQANHYASTTQQNWRRETNVTTTANTGNNGYRGRAQDGDKYERAYRPPLSRDNATSCNYKSSHGKSSISAMSSLVNGCASEEIGKKLGHGGGGHRELGCTRESPRSSIPSPALPGPRGSSVRSPSGWEEAEEWETASESSERCLQTGTTGKWETIVTADPGDDVVSKAPASSPRNEMKYNGGTNNIGNNNNASKRYHTREVQSGRAPKVGFGPNKYGGDNCYGTTSNNRTGPAAGGGGVKSGYTSSSSFVGETRTVNAGFGRGSKLSRNPPLPNGGPISRYDINDIASVVVIDDHPDARHSTRPSNAHPAPTRGTDDDFQEVLNRKALKNRNKTSTVPSSQHPNTATWDKGVNHSPQPVELELIPETRSVIDTMSEIGTWDEAPFKGDGSFKSDRSGKESSSPLDLTLDAPNTRVVKSHKGFPPTSQMVSSNNDKKSTTFGSPTPFASSGMTSSSRQSAQSHMKVRIPASPPPSSTSSVRHHHNHPSTPISPSAADLNLRIASVKKVWDTTADSQRDAWRSCSTEDFAITNMTCKSPGFKKANPSSQLPSTVTGSSLAKAVPPNATPVVVSSNVCKVKPHKQQSVTTSSSAPVQHQADYQQQMVSLLETPTQQSQLFDSPDLAAQFQAGSFLRTSNNAMAMYENFLAGVNRNNAFVAPPLDLSQLQPPSHSGLGDNSGDSLNAPTVPVQNNNALFAANYGAPPSQLTNAPVNSALEASINNSAGLLGFGPNFGQNYQNLFHSGNPTSNLTYNNHLGNNQSIPIGTFQPSSLVPTSLTAHNHQAAYHRTLTNAAVGPQIAQQSLDLAMAKPFSTNPQSQLHQGPRNSTNNNLATAPPMLLQLDPLNNLVDIASLAQQYQGSASAIAPRLPFHGHQESRPNNLYNYFPTPPSAPTSNLTTVGQPSARLTVNDYAAAYLNQQQQQNLAAALIGNSAQAQHQQHQNAVAAALQSIYSGDRTANYVPNIGDPSSPTPQESLLFNMIVGNMNNQGQGGGAAAANNAASMYLGGVLQRQHLPNNHSHQQAQQHAQQTQGGNERAIANVPPPFVTMSLSDYYLASDPSAAAAKTALPQPNSNFNHCRAGLAPPSAQITRNKYGHGDNKDGNVQAVPHPLQSNSVPNFLRKSTEASWTATRHVGSGYDGEKRKQAVQHKLPLADAANRNPKKVDSLTSRKSHSLAVFERSGDVVDANKANLGNANVHKAGNQGGHTCDDIGINDGKNSGPLRPVDPHQYSQLQAALVDSLLASSNNVKRDEVRDNASEASPQSPFSHPANSDLDGLAATGDGVSLKTNEAGAQAGVGIGSGICNKEEQQSLDAVK